MSYAEARKIGQNIKKVREQKGYSVNEVSTWLVKTGDAIRNYEHGTKYFPLKDVLILSRRFGVSLETLLGIELPKK